MPAPLVLATAVRRGVWEPKQRNVAPPRLQSHPTEARQFVPRRWYHTISSRPRLLQQEQCAVSKDNFSAGRRRHSPMRPFLARGRGFSNILFSGYDIFAVGLIQCIPGTKCPWGGAGPGARRVTWDPLQAQAEISRKVAEPGGMLLCNLEKQRSPRAVPVMAFHGLGSSWVWRAARTQRPEKGRICRKMKARFILLLSSISSSRVHGRA